MVQGSGADPSSLPVVWCGVVGLDAHYDSMVEAKMKR